MILIKCNHEECKTTEEVSENGPIPAGWMTLAWTKTLSKEPKLRSDQIAMLGMYETMSDSPGVPPDVAKSAKKQVARIKEAFLEEARQREIERAHCKAHFCPTHAENLPIESFSVLQPPSGIFSP